MEVRPCNKPPYNPKLRNRRNDSCLVPCIAPNQRLVGRDHGYGQHNRVFRGKRHQRNVLQSRNIHHALKAGEVLKECWALLEDDYVGPRMVIVGMIWQCHPDVAYWRRKDHQSTAWGPQAWENPFLTLPMTPSMFARVV